LSPKLTRFFKKFDEKILKLTPFIVPVTTFDAFFIDLYRPWQ